MQSPTPAISEEGASTGEVVVQRQTAHARPFETPFASGQDKPDVVQAVAEFAAKLVLKGFPGQGGKGGAVHSRCHTPTVELSHHSYHANDPQRDILIGLPGSCAQRQVHDVRHAHRVGRGHQPAADVLRRRAVSFPVVRERTHQLHAQRWAVFA